MFWNANEKIYKVGFMNESLNFKNIHNSSEFDQKFENLIIGFFLYVKKN